MGLFWGLFGVKFASPTKSFEALFMGPINEASEGDIFGTLVFTTQGVGGFRFFGVDGRK